MVSVAQWVWDHADSLDVAYRQGAREAASNLLLQVSSVRHEPAGSETSKVGHSASAALGKLLDAGGVLPEKTASRLRAGLAVRPSGGAVAAAQAASAVMGLGAIVFQAVRRGECTDVNDADCQTLMPIHPQWLVAAVTLGLVVVVGCLSWRRVVRVPHHAAAVLPPVNRDAVDVLLAPTCSIGERPRAKQPRGVGSPVGEPSSTGGEQDRVGASAGGEDGVEESKGQPGSTTSMAAQLAGSGITNQHRVLDRTAPQADSTSVRSRATSNICHGCKSHCVLF